MGSSPNIPVLIGSNIDVMSDEAGRARFACASWPPGRASSCRGLAAAAFISGLQRAGARSALDPVASLTFAAAICCLRTNAIASSEAKPGLSQGEQTSLLTHGQPVAGSGRPAADLREQTSLLTHGRPAADLRGCANLLCAPFPRRAAAAGGHDQKVTKGRRNVTFRGPQGRWIRSI